MITPEDVFDRAEKAARFLKSGLGDIPPVALLLGSGWDALLESRGADAAVDFDAVPGFSSPCAEGHAGRISVIRTPGGSLLIQEGRPHCYDGYSALEVSFPVFAYADAGVRVLIMLCAAGGLNPVYEAGDLIIVRDHIALWGENPLRGLPSGDSPPRSPHVAVAGIYRERWQEVLKASLPTEAHVEKGVYVHVPGPSYETAAEAVLLRIAGGDVVGMSMTTEALAAGYVGIDVAALCCVSNTLLPFATVSPSQQSVLAAVRSAARSIPDFLDNLAEKAYMIL
jgi:purine-nucleoside phosphorylase